VKRSADVFDVEDPKTGKRFQLYDFEVSLARMLNGRRQALEIVEEGSRLGIPITLETLHTFLRQLERYGFLVPDDGREAPVTEGPWDKRDSWDPALRELYQGGLRLLRVGRPAEAKSYFEAMLETDPQNPQALEMCALAEYQIVHGPPGLRPAGAPATPASSSAEPAIQGPPVLEEVSQEAPTLVGPTPQAPRRKTPPRSRPRFQEDVQPPSESAEAELGDDLDDLPQGWSWKRWVLVGGVGLGLALAGFWMLPSRSQVPAPAVAVGTGSAAANVPGTPAIRTAAPKVPSEPTTAAESAPSAPPDPVTPPSGFHPATAAAASASTSESAPSNPSGSSDTAGAVKVPEAAPAVAATTHVATEPVMANVAKGVEAAPAAPAPGETSLWRDAPVTRLFHPQLAVVRATAAGEVSLEGHGFWNVERHERVAQIGGRGAKSPEDLAALQKKVEELEALAKSDPVYEDFLARARHQLDQSTARIKRATPVLAPASGLFVPLPSLKKRVRRGQLVGTVHDLERWELHGALAGLPPNLQSRCEVFQADHPERRATCQLVKVSLTPDRAEVVARLTRQDAPWVTLSSALKMKVSP
jgi:hypothetical protein